MATDELRVQSKRGLFANLPNTGMLAGEIHYTTDRGTAHLPLDTVTKVPVVPAIDALNTMPAVDPASDLLIVHDASETTGQKEKKITIQNLKTAMNIPLSDTDEKVAVVSGGTAGYLYGDGTNGVLRSSPSVKMTKAADNGSVTLSVGVIDCGTF